MWGKIYNSAQNLFSKAKSGGDQLFHKSREGLQNFSHTIKNVGGHLANAAKIGEQVLNSQVVKTIVAGNPKLQSTYNLAHKSNQLMGLGGQISTSVGNITNEKSYSAGRTIQNGLDNAHDALQRAKKLKDEASQYNYI